MTPTHTAQLLYFPLFHGSLWREEKSTWGWELPWEHHLGDALVPTAPLLDIAMELHVQPLEVTTRNRNLVSIHIQSCPSCWAVGAPPWGSPDL